MNIEDVVMRQVKVKSTHSLRITATVNTARLDRAMELFAQASSSLRDVADGLRAIARSWRELAWRTIAGRNAGFDVRAWEDCA